MEMRSLENNFSQPENITRPLASVLAVTAGLFRLIPHPWNFTPVGALGLFAGARLPSWHAFAWPVGVMAGSDLLLWAMLGKRPFDPFVYASFLLTVLIGRTLVRTESPWRIGGASLLASVQFFLVTNFGAWLTFLRQPEPLYPPTLSGLLTCYAAGIPFFGKDVPLPLGFFGNTVLGDLCFVALLFGAHAWLSRRAFPAERVGAVVTQ
jgi:hypothetical protein